MPDTETVLRTFALTKTYSGRAAVDHLSMQVRRGEVYGLIGKNGAGKTTLIRMITSLIHPDSGEIELFGQKRGRQLHRVGSMVDTPVMYPNLTAEQNLEYYRLQAGNPDPKSAARALEIVDLSDGRKQKFGRLSLGMRGRLGLALAILNNPDFIILDEPAKGLDPLGIAAIRRTLKYLNEDLGITILISSHLLAELHLLATTYGIIDEGRLIKEFSKGQLDEACKRCLRLVVDDIQAAATILETVLGTTNYKVVDRNEIRVYDHLEKAGEVNYQLNAARVRVNAIYEMGMSLEDYLKAAIEEAR
jgi:ABC-2 type transport system ATP-binding protein